MTTMLPPPTTRPESIKSFFSYADGEFVRSERKVKAADDWTLDLWRIFLNIKKARLVRENRFIRLNEGSCTLDMLTTVNGKNITNTSTQSNPSSAQYVAITDAKELGAEHTHPRSLDTEGNVVEEWEFHQRSPRSEPA